MTRSVRSPLPIFFRARRRSGISELYASVLMIGATLALGSYITASAVGQFGLTASSATASTAAEGRSEGTMLSFVFSSVGTPGGCPPYGGSPEGSSMSIAVFNYGTSGFTPNYIAVNGTAYFGAYSPAPPATLTTFTVSLPAGSCAHPSGQEIQMTSASGEVLAFES